MAETALTIDLSKATPKQIRAYKKIRDRQQWFDLANKAVDQGGQFLKTSLVNPYTGLIVGAVAIEQLHRRKIIADGDAVALRAFMAAGTLGNLFQGLYSAINPFD